MTDPLAAQMAAALETQYPRIRVSQLEPSAAVAHGIFALADAAVGEVIAAGYALDSGQRRLMQVRCLEHCLETWQAESLDAKIAAWLRDHPRRSVDFFDCTGEGAFGVWLRDPACGEVDAWNGEGGTPGQAFASAMEGFDGTPTQG